MQTKLADADKACGGECGREEGCGIVRVVMYTAGSLVYYKSDFLGRTRASYVQKRNVKVLGISRRSPARLGGLYMPGPAKR